MNNDTITRYVNKYEKIGREFTIEMLNEIRKKGIKVNYRCTPTTAKHDMNVILNDKEHIIIEIKCRRYPSTHYYFQDGLFIEEKKYNYLMDKVKEGYYVWYINYFSDNKYSLHIINKEQPIGYLNNVKINTADGKYYYANRYLLQHNPMDAPISTAKITE